MAAQHSPGPWAYDNGAVYAEPIDEIVMVTVEGKEPRPLHSGLVALVYGHHIGDDHHYTHDDNARLIAAAPELLSALKALLGDIDAGLLVRDVTRDGEPAWSMHMLQFVQRLQAAQAAIARAEGR